MKKISIRLRLALWYGILTSILMVVFLPVFYQILCSYMYDDLKSNLKLSAKSVADDLNLYEGNIKNYKISSNIQLAIIGNDGNVLIDNCDMSWKGQAPFHENSLWQKTADGHEWMICDQQIKLAGGQKVTVRVFATQDNTISSIRHIFFMVMLGGILFIIFAFLGGLVIASKALTPIKKMIDTANEIKTGNMSKRIQEVNSQDEVGKLAHTFNSMLEHLEDSMIREKRFASDASHELRTPVAIIMNSVELLIGDSTQNGKELPDEYGIIYQESKRMKKVITQLSMLSKYDANKSEVLFEQFDLTEMINIVIEQQKEMNENSERIIEFHSSGKINLYGDQTLLTNMVINLIDNAIKYSYAEDKIEVNITEEKNRIIIKVIDQGIGMEKEDIAHIFERFYRADKARDRSGSGLGLSIVKWIVDVHHGEIIVISAPEKGSCFEVILPVIQQ